MSEVKVKFGQAMGKTTSFDPRQIVAIVRRMRKEGKMPDTLGEAWSPAFSKRVVHVQAIHGAGPRKWRYYEAYFGLLSEANRWMNEQYGQRQFVVGVIRDASNAVPSLLRDGAMAGVKVMRVDPKGA